MMGTVPITTRLNSQPNINAITRPATKLTADWIMVAKRMPVALKKNKASMIMYSELLIN